MSETIITTHLFYWSFMESKHTKNNGKYYVFHFDKCGLMLGIKYAVLWFKKATPSILTHYGSQEVQIWRHTEADMEKRLVLEASSTLLFWPL